MKSSTNHAKPFVIALGIAFSLVILTVLFFALKNGGLDIRSRAATQIKYTCMPRGECTPDVGTVVSNVYCGSSTCPAPKQCCKTTTSVPNTPTPTTNRCITAGGVCKNALSCASLGLGLVNAGNGCNAAAGELCCSSTTPGTSPYICGGCSANYDYTYATWQQTIACSAGKNPIAGTISYTCQCSCGYNSQSHQWNNCMAICAPPGIPMYYCRTDTKLCVMTSNLYADVITCSANLLNPSYPANKPNSGVCYQSLAACQSVCQ